MEGVVAGVPVARRLRRDHRRRRRRLAIRRTPCRSRSRRPAGKTYKQPGNFIYLIETSVFGTEPKFAAKGVKPDLDGDGKVEFGEALPDADFFVAAARDFEKTAGELDAAAQEWKPTPQDAFTALVVMTPTMSEYFEALEELALRRRRQGDGEGLRRHLAPQDIADILGGLVLVYDNVEPQIATVDAEQAKQTGSDLRGADAFAERLRDEEAGGKKFTAEDADTLGGEAQDARRGDRRPGLAGRRAARHHSSRARWPARCAVAAVLRRALRASPPLLAAAAQGAWRRRAAVAGRPRRSARALFDAQTELILGDRAAAARAACAARRAPTAASCAPRVARRRRRAGADASRRACAAARARRAPATRRALAAARGALRAALFRGAVRGDARRRSRAATPRPRARGCCCASSAPPRASPARAPTRRSR